MTINLKNPQSAAFGSVEWQDIMKHNIIEKIKHNEELGKMEKCFIDVQHTHNYRICKSEMRR